MTSADDPPPPASRWVSFAEAQKILNMTEGTLRRAIKAGTVQGEQRRRNPDSPTDQRMVYEVLVSDAPGAAAGAAAPIEAAQSPEPATIASDAITGLLALVADERERSDQLNLDLRVQAQVIGRLTAERDVARADLEAARAELARLTEARERRRWWRFWT